MNKDNQNNQSTPEIFAAKLALFGTALSTLGDGIQTIAAGIALEILENANNKTSPDQTDQLKQMEDRMQKEINQLTRKLENMERGIR